jgi:NAD(P)-dependent dehydrogenase (short-subunit alcohol dehydrogenase family)
MAARNQEKAARAADGIRAESPTASLEMVPLELTSLASVRTAAERILAAHPRVDILVNNAGVMAMPERRTEDGLEMQLGVNHLGQQGAMPLIRAATDPAATGGSFYAPPVRQQRPSGAAALPAARRRPRHRPALAGIRAGDRHPAQGVRPRPRARGDGPWQPLSGVAAHLVWKEPAEVPRTPDALRLRIWKW